MASGGAPIGRRPVLRRALAAAGAALLGVPAAGCSLKGARAAVPAFVGLPVPLQVAIPQATPLTGTLVATQPALEAAVRAAAAAARRPYVLKFVLNPYPNAWFPQQQPTLSLFNLSSPPKPVLTDAPHLPMPDLVLAPHAWIDGYLAIRALDLAPYVTEFNASSIAHTAALLRCGQAYAPGRGTIQAGLPVMRQPMVCAVPRSMTSMSGGRPWTLAEFGDAVQKVQAGNAGSTPLAYLPLAGGTPFMTHTLPDDSGLAAAAAVGYGGRLARSTAQTCVAQFDGGPALQALTALLGLLRLTPKYPSQCAESLAPPPSHFSVYMGLLSRALGYAPEERSVTSAHGIVGVDDFLPTPTFPVAPDGAWRLAPLPTFPSRPAVPVQNLDVMVCRETLYPEAAAELAAGLLGPAAQAQLAVCRSLLASADGIAAAQLAQNWTGTAEAAWMANAAHDVTAADGLGAQTAANSSAYALTRGNLDQSLFALSGPDGGFAACWSGVWPGPPGTHSSQCASVLKAAAAAARAGQLYTAPALQRAVMAISSG